MSLKGHGKSAALMHLSHPFITSAVSVVRQELKARLLHDYSYLSIRLHLGSKSLEGKDYSVYEFIVV